MHYKNIIRLLRIYAPVLCLLLATKAQAQLPDCNNGGIVYMLDGSTGNIYNYNPALPTSATNPILNTLPAFPGSAGGLTVCNNINGGGPSPTFYMVDLNGDYHYFNGTSWIATGQNSGNAAAVNIAGGGNAIYNLIGSTGQVYKYDGTGNGTLLMTIPGYIGPYDLVAECTGNFYALNTSSTNALQEYNSAGTLIASYTIVGLPAGAGNGGFAVVGNNVYCDNGGQVYSGNISGTTVTFGPPVTISTPSLIYDFASCPEGSTGNALANLDSAYYCLGGNPVALSVTGPGPFSWSVLSGPAVLSSTTGPAITVTSPAIAISKIVVTTSGVSLCGAPTDTVTLLVPSVAVNAGPDDTIFGCGTFSDTLHATVTPNLSNLNLTYSWSPFSAIVSGANTLDPVINPSGLTQFVLTVTTDTLQGGCSYTDTVNIAIVNSNPIADFDFDIQYGCGEDTVYFTNTSDNFEHFTWDFADGTGDTATSPVHIYPNQNTYNVKLIAYNKQCRDSVTKLVDTQHPLAAAFTVDDDSVCQGSIVTFSNASNYTTIEGPAKFSWSFGDGATDTTLSATHFYPNSGVYTVTLIVTDFVPCSDTASHIVVVDSIAYLSFTTSDSVLCEGQGITYIGDYYEPGLTNLTWAFGDGIFAFNQSPITHAYDSAGLYTVSLTGEYRICPDTTYTRQVEIRSFPSVNLGPDTTLCEGAQPILIRDLSNFSNPAATWMWNTGDSNTASILARHPGTYGVRVTLNGCSSSDSIEVHRDCYLDIPNSFTPNGDGTNDYFLPRQLLSLGAVQFKMTIYNRWGQEVFVTQKVDGRGWDGKFNDQDQPDGVYVYLIEIMLKNGKTEKYQGNVTLLR